VTFGAATCNRGMRAPSSHRVSPRLSTAVVLFALVACGDDQGTTPGTELGPCVQHLYCMSPLQCTDGICVHPDQIGETGNPTTNPNPGSVGDDPDSSSAGDGMGSDAGGSADGGGAEIYCTGNDSEGCICGHTADYGPLGAACSTSTVASPGMCCGSEGWPAYGGCSCWTLSCRELSGGDTCYCGIGSPDPADGDQAVESCSPNGGICCRDLSGLSCACWTDLTVCLDGYEQVGSCDTSTVSCGEGSSDLVACN
jgi:hypothetical protein